MTCNPFTSLTAKHSNAFLRPENIDIRTFDDVLDFDANAAGKFDKELLKKASRDFNKILRSTDLKNQSILEEKLEQAPVNTEELAEFLLDSALSVEALQDILDTEQTRRGTIRGDEISVSNTVSTVNLVSYPKTNIPNIHKKVETYIEGKPGIIRGKVKGTIDSNGSFKGIIDGTDIDLSELEEFEVTGRGAGIDDTLSGQVQISGSIRQSTDGIRLVCRVTGGSYEPGPVVFEVSVESVQDGSGSGATFNVVIGNNGMPLVTIARAGQDYKVGDKLVLGDLGIVMSVSSTTNRILTPKTVYDDFSTALDTTGIINRIITETSGDTNISTSVFVPSGNTSGTSVTTVNAGGNTSAILGLSSGGFNTLTELSSVPPIPITDFVTTNYTNPVVTPFTPGQQFINLINSLDIFLDNNYGSSITSGSCGSSFLNLISGLFSLFKQLSNFQVQLADMRDIWSGSTSIPFSAPSLLSVIQLSFQKIIDSLMNKALGTISNAKQKLLSVGRSVDMLSKEFGDVENFYSPENKTKISNVSKSIIQKMHDQFKNPSIDIIVWILTRLCQLSDFISNFLKSPMQGITSLLGQNAANLANLIGLNNSTLAGVTAQGGLRFSPQALRSAAYAAAGRSTAAGGSGGNYNSLPNGTTNPAKITPFPISYEDKASVQSAVSSAGWPGYFTFGGGILCTNSGRKLNNYDLQGNPLQGAGWKMIISQNPALFLKVKMIIEAMGVGEFIMNSAYRSYRYNAKIGGAEDSWHKKCAAVDISMSEAQAIKFIPLASANGFMGIAYYKSSGFLHVDLGCRRRTWGTAGYQSATLRAVINDHVNNKYKV